MQGYEQYLVLCIAKYLILHPLCNQKRRTSPPNDCPSGLIEVKHFGTLHLYFNQNVTKEEPILSLFLTTFAGCAFTLLPDPIWATDRNTSTRRTAEWPHLLASY